MKNDDYCCIKLVKVRNHLINTNKTSILLLRITIIIVSSHKCFEIYICEQEVNLAK
jgi:hypothetical protein